MGCGLQLSRFRVISDTMQDNLLSPNYIASCVQISQNESKENDLSIAAFQHNWMNWKFLHFHAFHACASNRYHYLMKRLKTEINI